MGRPAPDPPTHVIDLHGLDPTSALRKLARELHTARLRGPRKVLVVTGRGWGNRLQKPVLRPRVERWLAGPEGRRAGVEAFRAVRSGGALELDLRRP